MTEKERERERKREKERERERKREKEREREIKREKEREVQRKREECETCQYMSSALHIHTRKCDTSRHTHTDT